MSTFGLYPTDLKVPCSSFQCYGRAAYFLGKEDAPNGTYTIVCEQCASELKEQLQPANVVEVEAKPFLDEEIPFTDLPEEVEDIQSLEDLTVKELKEIAEAENIHLPSKATKPEIIKLLEEADHE